MKLATDTPIIVSATVTIGFATTQGELDRFEIAKQYVAHQFASAIGMDDATVTVEEAESEIDQ